MLLEEESGNRPDSNPLSRAGPASAFTDQLVPWQITASPFSLENDTNRTGSTQFTCWVDRKDTDLQSSGSITPLGLQKSWLEERMQVPALHVLLAMFERERTGFAVSPPRPPQSSSLSKEVASRNWSRVLQVPNKFQQKLATQQL